MLKPKRFYFTGSQNLQKAMRDELVAMGYTYEGKSSGCEGGLKLCSNYSFPNTRKEFAEIYRAGMYFGVSCDDMHFHLPDDWNKALEYCRQALEWWDKEDGFEVGDYIRFKADAEVYRVTEVVGQKSLCAKGIMSETTRTTFRFDTLRKATTEEVSQALTAACKKKGYKIDTSVKCLRTDAVRPIGSIAILVYDSKNDHAMFGGCKIYKNGQWAEIVDTWLIEMESRVKLLQEQLKKYKDEQRHNDL